MQLWVLPCLALHSCGFYLPRSTMEAKASENFIALGWQCRRQSQNSPLEQRQMGLLLLYGLATQNVNILYVLVAEKNCKIQWLRLSDVNIFYVEQVNDSILSMNDRIWCMIECQLTLPEEQLSSRHSRMMMNCLHYQNIHQIHST